MRRSLFALCTILFFLSMTPSAAQADWRWETPKFELKKVKPKCDSYKCHKRAKQIAKMERRLKIARYNLRREREWEYWTSRPIADCTWYGESGEGPEFSKARYTMPNSQGSGAYGKYQFMPETYASVDKYGDWSPLDQEIAGHTLYEQQGTGPWHNCH